MHIILSNAAYFYVILFTAVYDVVQIYMDYIIIRMIFSSVL